MLLVNLFAILIECIPIPKPLASFTSINCFLKFLSTFSPCHPLPISESSKQYSMMFMGSLANTNADCFRTW